MAAILERPSVRQAALPISVEQYHRLNQEEILSERTELLRGVIIERMTKSPLHTYVVQLLMKWLEASVTASQYVRKEEPLTFEDSEPEPNLAVVSGHPRQYRQRHPSTADLVIEVAVATVGLDRDKADIYAQAGVPEYWVLMPEERSVDIYRDPGLGGYQACEHLTGADAELAPHRLPQAKLQLGSLFD